MSWLVPRNELTVAQGHAVEMDAKQHRLVLGSPGSGKTLVLLHRARHLLDEADVAPERYRIFVFTNSLKAYIRAALDDLRLPADSVTTFDGWCQEFYKEHVKRTLPRDGSAPDFEAIRHGVWEAVRSMSHAMPLYDFVMVDEGQDLNARAYSIMATIATHLTVFMDHKQRIYETGIDERDMLAGLGLRRRTSTLLDAYRCSPYIVRTAAAFIQNPEESSAFIRQNPPIARGERQPPLLYLAGDFEDERENLIEVIRTRIDKGERIAVLFPTRKHVFGYAQGLNDAGVEVEVPARPGRRNQSGLPTIDFSTLLPKAMAYPSAKGLTFDTVLMPLLERGKFPRRLHSALLERWLFVGASRATRWLYFSAIEGECMFLERLGELARQRQLTIRRGAIRHTDSPLPVIHEQRDDLADLF